MGRVCDNDTLDNINNTLYNSNNTTLLDGIIASQNAMEVEPGLFIYYGIPFNPYMEIYGVFIVTVSCFGILGNLLAMVVLSTKEMSSVGTQLLFHLTIPDTFYLITIIILDGMLWLHPDEDIVDHVAIVCQPFLAPLSHTVFMVSMYLTVVLAVQRYFLVSRPLLTRSVITKRSMRYVVVVVYVFATVYNIPHWIALAPEVYWEPYLNRTWLQPRNQEFLFSTFYNVYYKGYINLAVKLIIPFLVLLVTTCGILIAMSKREFKDTNDGKKTGNRMTVIVLAVTVMSLLCNSTTSVKWVLNQFPWKGKRCQMECIIFGRIGNAMVVCNCVFNFFFYCLFGRKFRERLYSFFRHRSSSNDAVVHL